ncbi:MAG TPA: polysaccharide deacetylase family protein [Candidatus Saccharimonadales bacterium]|nr:polysaccharide deacetylase family protein [Candidatus Saccharimonadales bacterium]
MLKRLVTLSLAVLFALIGASNVMTAHAAVANIAPTAKVSFTFDDGYNSALSQAAPTLAKYGYSATSYVITGCVGMTTTPNTCQADNDKSYMTWDQISQLKNNYGWEIGSHTVTHPYLATSDPVDQPQPIPFSQVSQELTQSKADLAAHGIDAKSLATPYGDYNPAVLAEIAKYYSSQRGFADLGYNDWPNSDYFLREQQVQGRVSVATVEGYINNAIANNQWLVLVFHDIKSKASNKNDDYEYSTSKLDQIAAYIKSKNVQVANVSDALVNSDVNLLPNASFNSGISGGWTTDSPSQVEADSANNGSYPDPSNSVRLTSGATEAHLFSPRVSVNPNTNYMLKNFLNVKALTSGEVYFYVDEYDAGGNWISGQYLKAERSAFVEELNFTYKPTSISVASVSLQVGVSANSGITAYLDNTQLFPLSSTIPPVQTNLVANGAFDNGIAAGWTTNSPATITADSSNHGSPANPVNSVKLTSATVNRHLFSPHVSVDASKSYSLLSYLNLVQRNSGEVGFYIDEYDAGGNWISGQYKLGVSTLGASDVGLAYKPSSTNVKSASLQIIVMGNSGITAYFDDVRWYQN